MLNHEAAHREHVDLTITGIGVILDQERFEHLLASSILLDLRAALWTMNHVAGLYHKAIGR
jgi:hypothetical protein